MRYRCAQSGPVGCCTRAAAHNRGLLHMDLASAAARRVMLRDMMQASRGVLPSALLAWRCWPSGEPARLLRRHEHSACARLLRLHEHSAAYVAAADEHAAAYVAGTVRRGRVAVRRGVPWAAPHARTCYGALNRAWRTLARLQCSTCSLLRCVRRGRASATRRPSKCKMRSQMCSAGVVSRDQGRSWDKALCAAFVNRLKMWVVLVPLWLLHYGCNMTLGNVWEIEIYEYKA
jgi:hypothetical protein